MVCQTHGSLSEEIPAHSICFSSERMPFCQDASSLRAILPLSSQTLLGLPSKNNFLSPFSLSPALPVLLALPSFSFNGRNNLVGVLLLPPCSSSARLA